MYNFSIGGGSKDPYNFSIGGGGDTKSKGFGLTGNLSKAGGGLTGAVSSSFMSTSQAKKPSSTYSSGFGGGFGDLKSITQASQSAQSSKMTTSASSTSAASSKKGSVSAAVSSQPSGQSVAAKSNNAKKKGAKSKFGEDIIPRRFGLRYDPPTIIMEYMVPTNGKLYHHKMKMLKLQKDTAVKDGLEYLRKKHSTYLVNDNVSDDQLTALIERLQKRLPTEKKNALGGKTAAVTAKTTVDSKNGKATNSTTTTAAASKKADSMTTSTPIGKSLAPGKIEPLKKSNSLAPLGKNNDFSEPKASTMIRGGTTSANSGFGGSSSTIRSSSVGISSKQAKQQESESDEELDQEEDVFKYAWSKKGAGSIQANKPVPLSSVKNDFGKENGGIYGKNKANLGKGYGQQSDDDDDDDEDEDQYNYDQEDEEDEDDDGIDYQTYNLNKLSNDELKKHKDKMENLFRQNSLKPGDKDYQYNVEEEFNPDESNEWDEDEEE